jgi:hypothetical protein
MSGLVTQGRPIKGGQVQVRPSTLSPEASLKEHTMSTIDRSTNQSHQPHYARTSRSAKAAVAFVSVLMSSALLGGMLGLFEMQSADAAIARALIDAQPPTTWIALQRVGSASRG